MENVVMNFVPVKGVIREMEYLRNKGSDTWHWVGDCSNYPSKKDCIVYSEEHSRPSYGEFCNECLGKEKK